MQWRPILCYKFGEASWDKFDSIKLPASEASGLENLRERLFLYWANAVDYFANRIFPQENFRELSELNGFEESEEFKKYELQKTNEIINYTLQSVEDNGALISRLEKYPDIANDSEVQDSVLMQIVGRDSASSYTLDIIDKVLSNKELRDNYSKINKIFDLIGCSRNKEKADFINTFISSPLLYKNKLLQSMNNILLKGDDLLSAIKIMNKYVDEPLLRNNEDIKRHLDSIIVSQAVDNNYCPEMVIDAYLKNEKLQNVSVIKGNIGTISALAQADNIQLILASLRIPELYENIFYMTALLNDISSEDFNVLQHLTTDEILNKIVSSPALYGNKYILDNSLPLTNCNSEAGIANARVKLMDKYAENPKYYNNELMQKEIVSAILASNFHNTGFITEIMDDIVSSKPKRTYEENCEIIEKSIDGYFSSMEDYETYNRIEANCTNGVMVPSYYSENFSEDKNALSCLLKLTGEDSFTNAMQSMKPEDFRNLSVDTLIMINKFPEEFFEVLIQKMNLKASAHYKNLCKKLAGLKKKYVKCAGDDERRRLQKKINTLSSRIRELEGKEIKDYQLKFNLLRQMSQMPYDDAKAIIKLINNANIKNRKSWNEIMLRNVIGKLDIEPDKKLIKKLGLKDSPYLDKILISTSQFKNNFKDILMTVMAHPDLSIEEIFNQLPQNRVTREWFKHIGADYDKWIAYDSKSCIDIKDKNGKKLRLKKVNMNDVMYALFLGNYAGCCMKAGGGSLSSTAPNYVKNKFISAIEILDEGKPVGNTICYLALVKDRPAIILDNISLKPEYRGDDKIGQGFADYAKKLCTEIGLVGIPVYTTSNRQAVRIKLVEKEAPFYYVGSSGEEYVYMDDITEAEKISPETYYEKTLYSFEDLEPENPDGIDPTAISILPPNRNIYVGDILNLELHPTLNNPISYLPAEDDSFN